MPEFVFRRSFPWTQVALEPAAPLQGPDAVLSTLLPTFEIFGTQRIAEQKADEVRGGVGNLEVFHDAVPQQRIRLYSAAELTHDDGVNHWIRLGQIIRSQPGGPFNFVGFTSAAQRPGSPSPVDGIGAIAARSLWVGPGNRMAGRTDAIGIGAQLSLRLVWTELVLGEGVRFT